MKQNNVIDIRLSNGAKCLRKLSIEEAFIWIDFTSIKKSNFEAEMKNDRQEMLRQRILEAIENNALDGLYVAKLEPSVDDNHNIYFAMGADPGVGYLASWWDTNATRFCPERKSRNLSYDEYFMIMAYLIKNGSITWEDADCRTKGNFWDSPNSSQKMEKTGTRKCGEFYGFVGNTFKYVTHAYTKKTRYAAMGGSFECLSDKIHVNGVTALCAPFAYSLGWMVLER